MKKYITAASLLAAGTVLSNAAFVWNGGETITSDLWASGSSWTLTDGTVWSTLGQGSGPGTPDPTSTFGYDMWDPIFVSNASGSIDSLEGWALNLTLESTNLTVGSMKKFQNNAGANSYVTIDASSALTINSFGNPSGNDGQSVIVNNLGTFNLQLAKNQGGEGFQMNLGTTGVFNVTSASGSHTVNVDSVSATLTADNAVDNIVTRTLVSLSEEVSFNSTNEPSIVLASGIAGLELTEVSSLEGAAAGSYVLTKDENGISVSYVIPEPSAFGLIAGAGALALVAARRRRAK